MKVLFAVNDEKDAESITRAYQEEYKEIISSKTVYYFNAIIKELQKDKTYDRIVISEDLEMFSNNNYQAIDKFIFEKMDAISDEATNTEGNDIPIILLSVDRRTKNDPLLVKLFGLGLYNILIGQDRSVQKVCKLMYKPRTKKEAKMYYKVETENISYTAENKSNGVNETEIQNILNHYKKIGNNIPKCVKSFDSIVSQYSKEQVKLIVKVLPVNVKVILEENSDSYREIMEIKGKKVAGTSQLRQSEYVEKEITTGNKLNQPVIIPTVVSTGNVTKIKEQEKLKKEKIKKEEQKIAKKKAEEEARKKEEERIAKEKAEEEARRKEEERIAKEKAEEEARRKEEERIAKEKAEEETKIKEQERIEKEKTKNNMKEEIDTQTVKRGRGRPRKNPVLVVADEIPEKRKRGRPRKNVEIKEDVKEEPVVVSKSKVIEEKDKKIKKVDNYDEEQIDDEDLLLELDEFEDLEDLELDDIDLLDEEDLEDENLDDDELLEEFDDYKEDEDLLDLDDYEDEDEDELLDLDDYEDEDLLELDDYEDEDNEEDELLDFDDYEEEDIEEDETLPGFDDYEEDEEEEIEEDETLPDFDDYEEGEEEDIVEKQHNGSFKRINNRNYRYDNDLANSIKDLQETEETTSYNIDTDNLITSDQKIVAFVGTTKNGTSFIVNNLAESFSNKGIKTAILDLTKNKNSYYIYTNNEDELRKTAQECLEKLRTGVADGIKVNKNLTVFTSLPGEDESLEDVSNIIQTLLENYTVVLLDCDFGTDVKYFKTAQEIYLVQSLDVLTIQPLTAFLRDLKVKGVLETNKLRVVINKNVRMNTITDKVLIGGMSVYNDPGMTYMTELFDRDTIKYTTIPFEEQVYIRYLDGLVNCKISSKGYSKNFISSLNKLGDMVYPTISGKNSKKNFNDYSKRNKKFENAFSKSTSSTLEKMKNKF